MFAKRKISLFAKSDLYRKWVARRLLNDLPKVAKDKWESFDPDDVLHYAGLTTYRPGRAGIGGAGLFIVGAVVGGIAALLLAPKPGVELRGDVKDKAMGYINKQNIGLGTEKQANA
ncbi:YtxH domain-containing protein [Myxococcaceae bacterium GXIMD 01537]